MVKRPRVSTRTFSQELTRCSGISGQEHIRLNLCLEQGRNEKTERKKDGKVVSFWSFHLLTLRHILVQNNPCISKCRYATTKTRHCCQLFSRLTLIHQYRRAVHRCENCFSTRHHEEGRFPLLIGFRPRTRGTNRV